ncbi:MAG: glycosyltransferase involved in cell wall biosynthesis [Arenicella sp.]|jgi:glycosyltransferase involved in cell wall biosynthesis
MITAAISTYNREKYLPQLFESINKQTISPDLIEIILVDNNSPGNTKELFDGFQKTYPNLKMSYFLETNQGLSYGRNRGVDESTGKYITFLDDDAFISDDYLEKIYNYFEKEESLTAIGSKILLHYEDKIPAWENKYLNSLLGYFNLGDEPKRMTKDYPRGSNMSFRSDVFEKVGLFNVELGRKGNNLAGSEEKDIFQRIFKQSDMKVLYVPDAIVFHCVPNERTTAEFIKRQALGTGNGERKRVKNEGGMSTVKRGLIEIAKWGASLLLWVMFLFKGQVSKGAMIVKFRWWVSKGFFLQSKSS